PCRRVWARRDSHANWRRHSGRGGQAQDRCGREELSSGNSTSRQFRIGASLPLTSMRPIDLLVTELAVIAFTGNRATLVETAPGVTVQDVLTNTEATLNVPERVGQMPV